ncbi:MAG: hypothetical protein K2Z81_06970, partial [Cyanobacteria bacterium]|nr:hypothetical protein [Cyanobacteriota bacterium]
NGVSPPSQKTLKDIGTLTLAGKSFVDHRKELSVELTLSLDASILIRSRAGLNPSDPDIVHIQRPANGGKGSEPIIPGTSWAGVLRARVKKLVSQFHADEQTKKIVTSLFGSDTDERTNQTMSRIFINESVIENCREDLVQQRVAIDPFTGGAKDTALFDENPVYAKPDGRVMLRFRIINPSDLDIGLSLLLTKDLWTGELPVGGESSIGRGRFKGQEASVTVQGETGIHRWSITEKSGHLQITGDQQALEKYVSAVALPTAEV